MEKNLQECIAKYKNTHKEIMSYDISLIRNNQGNLLYPGFHIIFYSLRDNAMDILKTYPEEDKEVFWKICGEGKPINVISNIDALNIIEKCIEYLKSVSKSHSHE